MAATIRVTSHHGNADDNATTDVQGTSLYFKTADTDSSGGSVAHNVAGFNYSWIKQLRLRVQAAPIQQVYNLKAYWSTPTPVSNIDILMKRSAAYVDAPVNAATPLTSAVSAYTYTSAAPLSLAGSFTTGTDSAPLTLGDFVELQAKVGNATVASDVSLGAVIFRWDEI